MALTVGPVLLQNHEKKRRLNMTWSCILIVWAYSDMFYISKKRKRKKKLYIPDYRAKLCKTLAINGNNRPNQQFDSRIWGEPTPV